MVDVARLRADLESHEGFRSHLYICPAGFLTTAIGRNLEANPLTGREWRDLWNAGEISISISKSGAIRLLDRDITALIAECAEAFDFWHELNDVRRNVLAEMVYQIGLPGVLKFKQMLAHVRAGRWSDAKREGLDSKWARVDSPARARKLMARMESGVFT